MGCLIGENMMICGNFAKMSQEKPKGYDRDYKCFVPYPFKWRQKIGTVECDCIEVEEHFQPWYGFDWFHREACAILKHIKAHPGILNLQQFVELDPRHIASSE